MAPYSPPTGNRIDKTRLDFNENTIGCSPKVIEFLRSELTEERLSVYPDYASVRKTLSAFFGVAADEMLLTNGTDEAIQVLINTYIDDNDEVIALSPSYAMYRFYAEVAGAKITEVPYIPPRVAFPLETLLSAITPETKAILIANPNNPTGTPVGLEDIETILTAAPQAAVLIDEAYYEFCGITALPLIRRISESLCEPHFLESLRHGGDADGLSVLTGRQCAVPAQSPVPVQRQYPCSAGRRSGSPGYRIRDELRR